MGLPCRHICAVNGGATFEDAAVRWLMAGHQGCMDVVVFADSATKIYPGAVATEAAMAWSVQLALPLSPCCGVQPANANHKRKPQPQTAPANRKLQLQTYAA